ncbi:MAG: HupE/UreJ family protein, partial [Pseudomonadales bacterium]|nr:HupE/UreJ family protein [Pseudomonadales bacterium]
FTVAHALTFTAVLLRWVPTPPAWIEAAIAASILWLAIDVLRGASWGLLHGGLTLAFGLVHGLGFANALSAPTISAQGIGATLLALNAGVEGAQLLVATAVLAGLRVFASAPWMKLLRRAAAVGAGALAAFWVIARL